MRRRREVRVVAIEAGAREQTNLIVSPNSATLSFAPCLSLLTFSSAALNLASSSLNLASHLPSATPTFLRASPSFSSALAS